MQGKHERNARRHVAWPDLGQHEFLTHEGAHCAYGMNAVYQDGHHGNAIVSRHPIPIWENIDISHHPIESRGLLHCEIEIEGLEDRLARVAWTGNVVIGSGGETAAFPAYLWKDVNSGLIVYFRLTAAPVLPSLRLGMVGSLAG